MTLIQNEESLRGYVNEGNCSLVFDLSQQVKVFIKKKKIRKNHYTIMSKQSTQQLQMDSQKNNSLVIRGISEFLLTSPQLLALYIQFLPISMSSIRHPNMFPDSSLHEVHQTELELPTFQQDTRKIQKTKQYC